MSSRKEVPDEFLYKSLVGAEVKIVESSNKKHVGIQGTIVHETASFFHILQNGSIKRIFKEIATFELVNNPKALYIDGRLLSSTITHRIKKMR